MKSTILNLKERVLVVEIPRLADYQITETFLSVTLENGEIKLLKHKIKDLLFGGLEITEDSLRVLIDPKRISSSEGEIFPDYKNPHKWLYGKPTRLKSFISAIEANEMFWNNPLQSTKPTDDLTFYDSKEEREITIRKWQEAEIKTFHPDRTILFKII
jgi:hypothetical protein